MSYASKTWKAEQELNLSGSGQSRSPQPLGHPPVNGIPGANRTLVNSLEESGPIRWTTGILVQAGALESSSCDYRSQALPSKLRLDDHCRRSAAPRYSIRSRLGNPFQLPLSPYSGGGDFSLTVSSWP